MCNLIEWTPEPITLFSSVLIIHMYRGIIPVVVIIAFFLGFSFYLCSRCIF